MKVNKKIITHRGITSDGIIASAILLANKRDDKNKQVYNVLEINQNITQPSISTSFQKGIINLLNFNVIKVKKSDTIGVWTIDINKLCNKDDSQNIEVDIEVIRNMI